MTDKSQPIRVMRIIARLNIGGPAIHVSLLTERLSHLNYETMLVVGSLSGDEGDMSYYAEKHGIEPVVVPNLRREVSPIQDLRVLFAMIELMREFKPHVVHTHTAKAGFIGRLAARIAGVPVVVHTFHGHVFKGYFGTAKTQVFLMLERLAANLADTIITLTDSLRRELADEYKIARKSRMTVLPLGLDLDEMAKVQRKSGKFRAEFDIPADAPLIGIVARLEHVKNHRLFVDAAKQIQVKKPDAKFVIVGDGDTCQQIRTYVKELGLEDAVIFTGWRKDVGNIYSDLDVKVITSLNEGTPVTLIEALAAGCPVVATDVGGVGDLLEGGVYGSLVPSGDASAVATAVCDMLDNPPDPEIARKEMIRRYGIDRLVRDIDSLYRGLLMRKGIIPLMTESAAD